jgi:hypothetical protein
VTIRLGYRPPYDWDSTLGYLRAGAKRRSKEESRKSLYLLILSLWSKKEFIGEPDNAGNLV